MRFPKNTGDPRGYFDPGPVDPGPLSIPESLRDVEPLWTKTHFTPTLGQAIRICYDLRNERIKCFLGNDGRIKYFPPNEDWKRYSVARDKISRYPRVERWLAKFEML